MAGPLDGIRILDLTGVVLGPFATQTLGDWGADVIKVEPPAGDLVRNAGIGRHPGMASVFMGVNRNKRSLCLDIKAAEGADILRRLIATVDVLASNVRPAGMARAGFSWEAIQALNPKLVYAVATGFGQDGPHRAKPAFDEIIQAASGFADVMGAGGPPAFAPSLVADKITGMALVQAILAALFHRERTGEGQLVEVPMLETITAFVAVEHLGGLSFDPPIGPPGYKRLQHRKPAPTADGWITLLPYTPAHWRLFFSAAGRPELADALAVDDPVQRNARIDEYYAAIAEISVTRPTAHWLAICEAHDIPATAFSALETLHEHPHLAAVGLFQAAEHPTEGAIRYARPPARFERTPASVRRPAPLLGEHSAEILAEAGYDAAAIAGFIASGVVKAA